ncbi:MAG: ATP-binding protein [Rhizonema sp. PD38]|nr:ATP-binding protein [Rhizonema sp. PD38]
MEQKFTVLIVDDDEVDRMAVRRSLLKAGVEIELSEVSDGNSAIAAFPENSYDCVFLDYLLPDQDGLTLTRKIRSLGIKVPIVVLTGQGDEQIAVELMKAGATDYLSKSRLSPEILARVLRNAIRVYRAEMEVEKAHQQLQESNNLLTRKNKELERQQQQIELQNIKLVEASRLKTQFLGTISHELRTPMSAIIGFSQLLLRNKCGSLSHQQKDLMERILNNSKKLLMLLNEILDFSKFEVGQLDVKPGIFDLSKVVNATVVEIRSLAEQKNLSLQVLMNLENPIVFNDSIRVKQILMNLLSNALKFTESGGIAIEVKELSENKVVIAVCDTGIGIAPANIKSIFEAFWQVEQDTNRKYSGTGLGLPIVNALVQMMGGKITVKSQLNEGSIFLIELPRQVVPVSQNRERVLNDTDIYKKKVLESVGSSQFPSGRRIPKDEE